MAFIAGGAAIAVVNLLLGVTDRSPPGWCRSPPGARSSRWAHDILAGGSVSAGHREPGRGDAAVPGHPGRGGDRVGGADGPQGADRGHRRVRPPGLRRQPGRHHRRVDPPLDRDHRRFDRLQADPGPHLRGRLLHAGRRGRPSRPAGSTQTVTQIVSGVLVLALAGFAPWLALKVVHFAGDHAHQLHALAATSTGGARAGWTRPPRKPSRWVTGALASSPSVERARRPEAAAGVQRAAPGHVRRPGRRPAVGAGRRRAVSGRSRPGLRRRRQAGPLPRRPRPACPTTRRRRRAPGGGGRRQRHAAYPSGTRSRRARTGGTDRDQQSSQVASVRPGSPTAGQGPAARLLRPPSGRRRCGVGGGGHRSGRRRPGRTGAVGCAVGSARRRRVRAGRGPPGGRVGRHRHRVPGPRPSRPDRVPGPTTRPRPAGTLALPGDARRPALPRSTTTRGRP